MKNFLVGLLIIAGIMFGCEMAQGKTLEETLANSVPVAKGACLVYIERQGKMVVECVKGKRIDGTFIYVIIYGGEVLAVYEDVPGGEPKEIWNKSWQNA